MTLRSRLALLASVAVGVAVILVAAIAWAATRNELRSGTDHALRERAGLLLARPPAGDRPGPRPGPGPGAPTGQPAAAAASADPLAAVDTSFQFVDRNGAASGQSRQGVTLPVTSGDMAVAGGTAPAGLRDLHTGGQHLRMLVTPAGPGRALEVARSVGEIDSTLQRLAVALIFVGAAGVAAAALVGQAVARRSLRPVAELTDAAERVATEQDLSTTITVARDDEVGRLATTFNQMLTALRRSRAEQHALVTDASHELRTPLTSLRTNVEVLERNPDLPEAERTVVLGDVRAELEELSSLVAELVDLATDSASEADPEPVRLDDVVARACARAERRRNAPVETTLDPTVVSARSARLERAVSNLLDNATAWSPADAPIEVTLHHGELLVRDHGPGIDEVDLDRVFDRFYRSTAARGRPGSGLGLAIVNHVVNEHGGTVSATNAPDGGAVVGFRLPTIDPA